MLPQLSARKRAWIGATLSSLIALVPASATAQQTQARARQFGNVIITPSAGKSEALFQQEINTCSSAAPTSTDDFVKCMLMISRGFGGKPGYNNRADFAAASSASPMVPRPSNYPTQTSSTAAAIASNPEAAKYNRILDEIVAQDSETWSINKYHRGSMQNASIVSRDGSSVTVRGIYTYNHNDHKDQGWVEAQFVNEKVTCLRFHDFAGTCRPPRDINQLRAAAARDEEQARAQRAAWEHLPTSERQARCQRPCASRESSCESNNLNGNMAGLFAGVSPVGPSAFRAVTHEDCGQIYNSCLRSCIATGN
jgi:hypothetical protein